MRAFTLLAACHVALACSREARAATEHHDLQLLKAAVQHTLSSDAEGSVVGFMSLEKEQHIQMTEGKKGHGLPPLEVFVWRGFVCAIDEALKKVEGHKKMKVIMAFSSSFERVVCDFIGMAEKLEL